MSFTDLDRAVADLRGATVALEGDESLLPLLAELAESVGAQPVLLPEGGKAAYHAAAMMAAGGLIGLLDAIAQVAAAGRSRRAHRGRHLRPAGTPGTGQRRAQRHRRGTVGPVRPWRCRHGPEPSGRVGRARAGRDDALCRGRPARARHRASHAASCRPMLSTRWSQLLAERGDARRLIAGA